MVILVYFHFIPSLSIFCKQWSSFLTYIIARIPQEGSSNLDVKNPQSEITKCRVIKPSKRTDLSPVQKNSSVSKDPVSDRLDGLSMKSETRIISSDELPYKTVNSVIIPPGPAVSTIYKLSLKYILEL